MLTYEAARKKDSGERVDLEGGHGEAVRQRDVRARYDGGDAYSWGYGYIKTTLERYYRDAPLMIIGEGTNEIQKLVIARRLLQKYQI